MLILERILKQEKGIKRENHGYLNKVYSLVNKIAKMSGFQLCKYNMVM